MCSARLLKKKQSRIEGVVNLVWAASQGDLSEAQKLAASGVDLDGADCRLATRTVQILPTVVDKLPPCIIRKQFRWYSQEGGAACKRCPAITTVSYDLSLEGRKLSGLPVIQETVVR